MESGFEILFGIDSGGFSKARKRKERRVSEYYKKQERLLEGFNEMETINETCFASGVPTKEEIKKLAKSERLAVHISNATNLVLFVAKVYASMAMLTANAMRKLNQFHYLIGKRRMQHVVLIVKVHGFR
ncbi:predicted protein [Arabidopsis lyrata subsp. lyrata]|uniref:Predicted protein n=1 Tax=Arabidopsis lyrata subsp. lyrata TaxID=81972 RepID=D7KJK4_ARALL|nr:predicted protein [Arabidopsis lyrata subsp. lyrata]